MAPRPWVLGSVPHAPPRLCAQAAARPLSLSEPPEPASRSAALAACSACALAPHKHAAATAHASFTRPRDAQNRGNRGAPGTSRQLGQRVPALGHLSALQSHPERPCLPPPQPCACPSTYLGGPASPASCEGGSPVPAQLPPPLSSGYRCARSLHQAPVLQLSRGTRSHLTGGSCKVFIVGLSPFDQPQRATGDVG